MMTALPVTFPRKRRRTRQLMVGRVPVGGAAPISVQSMTKTDTRDVRATLTQIRELEELGCDLIRLAVVDEAAARALREIKKEAGIPLIADIHFRHRLALLALDAGIDGLRINPGNIGGGARLKAVVEAAAARAVPIRVGVNAGSLEPDVLRKHGEATPAALVESALRNVRQMEDLGFTAIKISVKASDTIRTVQAYRMLSRLVDYPLHLGVTEAGTLIAGTVRSSVALGVLLGEGIGDTIRISLTAPPSEEVRAGLELLRSLRLRPPGPNVIACPTCGRVEVDMHRLVHRVEEALEQHYRTNPAAPRLRVAVMGCMVNGPGEAREADVAVAGGKGKGAVYVRGKLLKVVAENAIVATVMAQVTAWEDKSEGS